MLNGAGAEKETELAIVRAFGATEDVTEHAGAHELNERGLLAGLIARGLVGAAVEKETELGLIILDGLVARGLVVTLVEKETELGLIVLAGLIARGLVVPPVEKAAELGLIVHAFVAGGAATEHGGDILDAATLVVLGLIAPAVGKETELATALAFVVEGSARERGDDIPGAALFVVMENVAAGLDARVARVVAGGLVVAAGATVRAFVAGANTEEDGDLKLIPCGLIARGLIKLGLITGIVAIPDGILMGPEIVFTGFATHDEAMAGTVERVCDG